MSPVRLCSCAALLALGASGAADTLRFARLPEPIPGRSLERVTAVSGDGRYAVGSFLECDDDVPPCLVVPSNDRGLRWDLTTGEVLELAPPPDWSFPTDCSEDGSVVVGGGPGPSNVWTAGDGWSDGVGVAMGEFDASAVSASADVLVGTQIAYVDQLRIEVPVRWAAPEGLTTLASHGGVVRGVSGDGSVAVGEVADQPVRWTPVSGMEGLGTIDPEDLQPWGRANAISADGRVIVGASTTSALDTHAFRWTKARGMQDLGSLGHGYSEAISTSRDGRVVVGRAGAHQLGATEAWIWDARRGMRTLRDVLEEEGGLDLSGWQLSTPRDVSFDGTVVVGEGYAPTGEQTAWVARVPEPRPSMLGTIAALALGTLARVWQND